MYMDVHQTSVRLQYSRTKNVDSYKQQVKRQCCECLPATVSKQKEKNAKDDAGGANMDADDNAAERGLSIPALTQTLPSCRQKIQQKGKYLHDGRL